MVFYKFFIFFVLLNLFQCRSSKPLVTKENLINFNSYYKNKIYILKEDRSFPHNISYSKREEIKIFFESTETLFKVKMYPKKDSLEKNPGQLLTYLVNSDFDDKKIDITYINSLLSEFLILKK